MPTARRAASRRGSSDRACTGQTWEPGRPNDEAHARQPRPHMRVGKASQVTPASSHSML